MNFQAPGRRAWSVLDEAGHEEALRLLQNHVGLRLSTLVPGVLFPIGLLLLAAGLYRSRQLRLPTAVALAVGASFFPVDHAAGNPFAMVAGDLVLLAALGASLSSSAWMEPIGQDIP